MKIYTIMSNNEPVPRATFVDYHGLVMYVRKNCCDTNKIYESESDSWNEFDEIRDISESVYANAYNGFTHYKDKNYEIF
jgi:hypothetical protein